MKKIILTYVLFTLIIAPVSAYGLFITTQNHTTSQATTIKKPADEEFLAAIKKYNNDATSIKSVKVVNDWWYVVDFNVPNFDEEGSYISTAVLYKFTNNESLGVAIIPAGDIVDKSNIQPGMGLPYEIFDMFNTEGEEL